MQKKLKTIIAISIIAMTLPFLATANSSTVGLGQSPLPPPPGEKPPSLTEIGLTEDQIAEFEAFTDKEEKKAYLETLGFSPEPKEIGGREIDLAGLGLSLEEIEEFESLTTEEKREFLEELGIKMPPPDGQRRAGRLTFNDEGSIRNLPAVDFLSAKGIIEGRPSGSFDPEGYVNRIEGAIMIMRIKAATECENETANSSSFPDVDPAEWYAACAEEAKEQGILLGDPNGNLRPGDTVNKVELNAMIVRALAMEVPEYASYDLFVDTPEDSWYAPTLQYFKDNEIIAAEITETAEGDYYYPGEPQTRDAFAGKLYLAMDFMGIVPAIDETEYAEEDDATTDDGTTETNVCGDATVDEGEECDDGNTTSGDGCSATCETEATE